MDTSLPINQPTPEIAKWHARWRKNRTFIAGEDAVKACGQLYLPKMRADDGPEHYARHVANTSLYPASSKIALGIEGLIFRAPEQLSTTSARAQLLSKSITPRNHSLTTLAKAFVREKLTTNFTGLLADHPAKDGFTGLNADNADRKGYRPRVSLYAGESILEVTEGPVGLNHQLVHVRLLEDNGKRVRQLLINDEGFYEQRVYVCDSQGQFNRSRFTSNVPRVNNLPLTEIPFVLDTSDGGVCPSPAMIENTVDLNLAHYRLSGLLANMTWMTSGPVVIIPGFTRELDADGNEVDPMWDFGPNGVIEIKADVTPHWFKFDPQNSELLIKQLADKKTDLSTLGHSILAPEKAAPEAPEAIILRRVAENATLAGFAGQASQSLERVLQFWASWIDEAALTFTLNTDFQPSGITPAEHKELRDDWLNGAITHEQYLYALRDGEVISRLIDPATEAERAKAETADRPTLAL
jgi:hypothetical protein